MPRDASGCLPKGDSTVILRTRQQGFAKYLRIRTKAEFDYVFARPCRISNRCFAVLARANNHPHPRLGLVISKRCAKSAVQRNRLKRLVRESFRQAQQELAGLDVVVIGKPAATTKTNQEIFTLLDRQWMELERCKDS